MASHSTHIWVAFFLILVVTVILGVFLGSVSPASAKVWQFGLVYCLVFLWIYSFALIAGYGLRVLFWKKILGQDFMQAARRQALLLGFLGVFVLLLEAVGLFNLKTAVPLVIIFALIELYAQ